MIPGRPEGDFSIQLKKLVTDKRIRVIESGQSGPRNLSHVVFQEAGKSYSLSYDPAKLAIFGEGVTGRYFPQAVAERIDGVLGIDRVIDKAQIDQGRHSRYLWANVQPQTLQHIKVAPRKNQ